MTDIDIEHCETMYARREIAPNSGCYGWVLLIRASQFGDWFGIDELSPDQARALQSRKRNPPLLDVWPELARSE